MSEQQVPKFDTAYNELNKSLSSGKVIHDSTGKGPCPVCESRVKRGLQKHINEAALCCDDCMTEMSKVPKGNIQQHEPRTLYFGNRPRQK